MSAVDASNYILSGELLLATSSPIGTIRRVSTSKEEYPVDDLVVPVTDLSLSAVTVLVLFPGCVTLPYKPSGRFV